MCTTGTQVVKSYTQICAVVVKDLFRLSVHVDTQRGVTCIITKHHSLYDKN